MQALSLREFFLVSVKREECGGFQLKRGGHMQNIKAPVPAFQRAARRNPLRIGQHLGQVADLRGQPAGGPVCLKLRPIQSRRSGSDSLAKFSEAQCVAQLVFVENGNRQREPVGRCPPRQIQRSTQWQLGSNRQP